MVRPTLLIALLFTGQWFAQPPASAVERVAFESAALPPSPFRQRLAKQQGLELTQESGQALWGYLSKPEGEGPFAAVVMLHGCNGLPPGGPSATTWLTDEGYVTLQIDSLGPRGLNDGCSGEISATERVLDAYGAAAFLKNQAFVDGTRLAVMGWSQGGTSAISAVIEESVAAPLGRPFRAAVAFYPFCSYTKSFYAPVLILAGAEDQATPARFCQRSVEAMGPGSAPADVVVYPGAHHAFMAPRFAEGRQVRFRSRRFWAQFDPEARRDALARAKAFLARHLK